MSALHQWFSILFFSLLYLHAGFFFQLEAKETADVFEEFVASFEESDSSGKAFVRGSTSIKPAATGEW